MKKIINLPRKPIEKKNNFYLPKINDSQFLRQSRIIQVKNQSKLAGNLTAHTVN